MGEVIFRVCAMARHSLGYLLAFSSLAAAAQSAWYPMLFAVQLEPLFASETIVGSLQMDFSLQQRGVSAITLDSGDLRISSVSMGAKELAYTQNGAALHIALPDGLPANQNHRIAIRYTGKPSSGLRFDKESVQVSTAFSTSQWMPCLDVPAVRAPLHLTLLLPTGLVSVANGAQQVPQAQPDGKTLHVWRMAQAMPSYLYGFAAGNFATTQQVAGRTTLKYFGPSVLFDASKLQQVFADSADMLAFFTQRSGVDYPLPTYSQVLLMGPAAQEMAGFSVMGARYGTRVLADHQAIWLGAHEMAHQWWGNGLTNRSWRHFWLNEGIATFMTAAYMEHRFGTDVYRRHMDAARVKYHAVRDAGQDKSLVFPNWDNPTAADRSLVYDKGALVLHELRSLLGEEAFWTGIKTYTQRHWGTSVETGDFVRAMEDASHQDLSVFFERWVYAKEPAR
nr:M1 family aminopeptidase [uncultured Rhodoferax sp.]